MTTTQHQLDVDRLTDDFRALAQNAMPLQQKITEITAKQVATAFELNVAIIKDAFPGIQIDRVAALAEIRPTDLAKQAREAVRAISESGIIPTRMIVDTRRMIVHVFE